MSDEQKQEQTSQEEKATPAKPAYFVYDRLKITELPQVDASLKFSKTFHVEYTDPDTEAKYTGDFTCRRLNQKLLIDVGAYKSAMSGGMWLSPDYDQLAGQIAYLRYALEKSQPWWKPETSYDMTATRAMYEYVRTWEDSFRR